MQRPTNRETIDSTVLGTSARFLVRSGRKILPSRWSPYWKRQFKYEFKRQLVSRLNRTSDTFIIHSTAIRFDDLSRRQSLASVH
jgi:hypothetical protein